MNILINTLSVSINDAGIKTYLINIIENIININDKYNIVIICSNSNYELFKNMTSTDGTVKLTRLPFSTKNPIIRIIFDQLIVPLLISFLFNKKKDVLITPSSVASLITSFPQILIIQAPLAVRSIRKELPKEFMADFSLIKRIYYDYFLPKSLVKSDLVITVSKYLKSKILELKYVDKEKVKVIYEGVDKEKFRPVKERGKISNRIVLFVSTLYKYKNLDVLIDVFSKLYKNNVIPKNSRLVVVGGDPTGGERVKNYKKKIRNNNLMHCVDFLGYVSNKEISKYYNQAFLFVYPSSVETFGLPPLEAMACGVPVIGSNIMSLPEIIGDAGLIVDPDIQEELYLSMKKIFKDNKLRNGLIQKGYQRVEKFSWHNVAEQIFEEIVNISNRNSKYLKGDG